MAAERLSMRKLREIFRLHFDNKLSTHAIGRSCGVSSSTVQEYLGRFSVHGLCWPLSAELDDNELEKVLFQGELAPKRGRPEPDWPLVHRELKNKHVTKLLVWQEYREGCPEGLSYSQFCVRYRRYKDSLGLVARRDHKAGERMFVDFSGDGIDIVDAVTGEVQVAKLFVAVLGASNLTYIEPVLHEDLSTWIQCHINAFNFFGGVAEITVPDNLKSGVTKPDYYEPDINPTYAALAAHYGTAVIPARVRRPRDKAKVEQGVLLAERWVIAVLRHRTFASLVELRAAVHEHNAKLNNRLMKKLGYSRRQLFEVIEKQVLKPLPESLFELCEYKRVRVNLDYHVEYAGHYYSVHYSHFINQQRDMEVRATATSLEVFWASRRVASHVRSYDPIKRYVTLPEHMPASHRRHLEWTPLRLVGWGQSIGPSTAKLIEEILQRRPHPEQGFKSCLAVLHLAKDYPTERFERACARAVYFRAYSYKSVKAILKNNLDKEFCAELPPHDEQLVLPLHENVRGPEYYH